MSSEHSAFTPLSRASMALGALPDFVRNNNGSALDPEAPSKSCNIVSNRSPFSSPPASPSFKPHSYNRHQQPHQHHNRLLDTNSEDNDNACVSPAPTDSNSEGSRSSLCSPRSPDSPLSPGIEVRPPSTKENHQCSNSDRRFSFSVEDILKPDKKRSPGSGISGGCNISAKSNHHSSVSPSFASKDLRWTTLPQHAHLHPQSSIYVPAELPPPAAVTATTQSSTPTLPAPSAAGLSWFLNSRFPQSNSKYCSLSRHCFHLRVVIFIYGIKIAILYVPS